MRNQDDHVKNIAFLMNKQGDWSLAPAFDVTYSYNPTGSWTAPHQMSVNGKQDGFSLEDFERCAKSALMKRGRATTIIEEVQGLGMRRLETSTARPKSGRGLPHSMTLRDRQG
ncbi:MAG: HipA domain-containing protein [Verrucomicrobia bacterium]|nr:HipA domain-containing protein [Verrucomicrobiota bacterium]